MQLRSLSSADAVSPSLDIINVVLLVCSAPHPRLSALGLSCLQKLIAHNAVAPTMLPELLRMLQEVSNCRTEFP